MYIEAVQARVDALRKLVHASRVLCKHPPIKKVSQIHLLEHWRNDNLNQYRRKVHIDPNTFDGIVDKICNDNSFYNDSNVPQAPVEVQLAIFLYRAGHYGNTASPEAIGHWAGISPGTVVNCTNCIMMALLALHDEYVHFLTAEEKESAKAWVEEKVLYALSGEMGISWSMEQSSRCSSGLAFMATLGSTRISPTHWTARYVLMSFFFFFFIELN
jgi:hypothetical protein